MDYFMFAHLSIEVNQSHVVSVFFYESVIGNFFGKIDKVIGVFVSLPVIKNRVP